MINLRIYMGGSDAAHKRSQERDGHMDDPIIITIGQGDKEPGPRYQKTVRNFESYTHNATPTSKILHQKPKKIRSPQEQAFLDSQLDESQQEMKRLKTRRDILKQRSQNLNDWDDHINKCQDELNKRQRRLYETQKEIDKQKIKIDLAWEVLAEQRSRLKYQYEDLGEQLEAQEWRLKYISEL